MILDLSLETRGRLNIFKGTLNSCLFQNKWEMDFIAKLWTFFFKGQQDALK